MKKTVRQQTAPQTAQMVVLVTEPNTVLKVAKVVLMELLELLELAKVLVVMV